MPKPEEYASAEARLTFDASIALLHHPHVEKHYTLALRWLRVGAAMEAGTVIMTHQNSTGEWFAYTKETVNEVMPPAPDPLTAAERAMGVAT